MTSYNCGRESPHAKVGTRQLASESLRAPQPAPHNTHRHAHGHTHTHTLVAWAQERAHQNRPYSRTSLLTAGTAMRTYLAGWMKVPL